MAKKLEYNTDYLFNYDVKESVNSVIDEVDGLISSVSGLIDTINSIPESPSITFIGDSITEGESSDGAFSRIYGILSSLDNRVYTYSGFNKGVGGDTSQDIINRMSNIGASMGDIADLMVGVNDVSMNVSVSDYIANIKYISQMCFNYGAKIVVIRVPYPKFEGATFPWNASQYALYDSYVEQLNLLNIKNVVIDNTSKDTVDSSSIMTVDGTHLSIYGALVFGAAQAGFLSGFIKPTSITNGLLSSNLFTNPLLTGASGALGGGIATGQVANGWTVGSNHSGMSVVCSKTNNVFDSQEESQTIEIIGANTSAAFVTSLKQSVSIPSSSSSDVYIAILRYKIEKSKGLSNVTAKIINNVFESVGEFKSTREISVTGELEGHIVTSVYGNMASGLTTLNVEFPIKFAVTDVDFKIHLSSPILRKIK